MNQHPAQASSRSWNKLVAAMDTAEGTRATGPEDVSVAEYTAEWERVIDIARAQEEKAESEAHA